MGYMITRKPPVNEGEIAIGKQLRDYPNNCVNLLSGVK